MPKQRKIEIVKCSLMGLSAHRARICQSGEVRNTLFIILALLSWNELHYRNGQKQSIGIILTRSTRKCLDLSVQSRDAFFLRIHHHGQRTKELECETIQAESKLSYSTWPAYENTFVIINSIKNENSGFGYHGQNPNGKNHDVFILFSKHCLVLMGANDGYVTLHIDGDQTHYRNRGLRFK